MSVDRLPQYGNKVNAYTMLSVHCGRPSRFPANLPAETIKNPGPLAAWRVTGMNVHRVANVIDGVAYYGEPTMSATTAYASFVRSVRIPTKELGSQMMQGIMPTA